jgi:hypothetical protein
VVDDKKTGVTVSPPFSVTPEVNYFFLVVFFFLAAFFLVFLLAAFFFVFFATLSPPCVRGLAGASKRESSPNVAYTN